MFKNRCILKGVFLAFSFFVVENPVFAKSSDVYMSRDLNGIDKTESFFCREKVFVHADLENLQEREYTASVVWVNPKGQHQDSSSHTFKGGKHTRVWFWLGLTPGFGGKLMKGLDPSFGMEGFEGIWKVRLYLDDKTIEEKFFFVSC